VGRFSFVTHDLSSTNKKWAARLSHVQMQVTENTDEIRGGSGCDAGCKRFPGVLLLCRLIIVPGKNTAFDSAHGWVIITTGYLHG
jgi:hypothetical protein